MKRQSLLFFGWLLLATPAAVQAQFTYTTNNGAITITGYTGPGGVVSIPDTINGLPVTSIGPQAFFFNNITGVTIPNSVTSIGFGAFEYCISLTSVTISDSVTSIGGWAFNQCSSLINVTIPKSVTNIGGSVFNGCSSLTNIMVDPLNSAFSSVDGVLFNQNQTVLVQYPEGKRGGYTIPNSVTNIGDFAFNGCSSLTNINLGSSVTTIEGGAFSDCSSLTSVTIPNGVTNIGGGTFEYCTSLTSVIIPNSVTSIGDGTFFGCNGLTSVTIPNSVTSIGYAAFEYCTSLTNVTLGNGVTSIGDNAFDACISLTSVTIGNSVTSIGGLEFYSCTSLTDVRIGNSVTSIEASAFGFCTNLPRVTIPNSIITIGDSAFYYCTGLTNVTIPVSVTNMGDFAFADCTGLRSLYFQGNAPSLGGTNVFLADKATIYYLPGTSGWGPTFDGLPTAVWTLSYPVILTSTTSFGLRSNQFSFTVSWATNLNVVVEAATDLANPVWSPVATNALSGGTFSFSDPQWKNFPSRFYRVRSQ